MEVEVDTVVQELKDELNTIRRTLEDLKAFQSPLLGIDQVAVLFGKSTDTIRRWVKERVISCYRIPTDKGFSYLFSLKQIEEDLNDYVQPKI